MSARSQDVWLPPAELRLRHQAKAQLRRKMLSLRKALPDASRQARSTQLAERFFAHVRLSDIHTLATFVPFRSEADPRPIMHQALDAGCRIALPRVDAHSGSLSLHRYEPGDALTPSLLGVPEPAETAEPIPPAGVDLILVPALAADPRGHRVGYGKGFYDRMLPTLTRARSCITVFDFQLIGEVPNTPGDHTVDAVVTDAQFVQAHPQRPQG